MQPKALCLNIAGAVALAALVIARQPSAMRLSDVQDLDQSNFASNVLTKKLILVMYFTGWCAHSKKLAPAYEIVATKLRADNIPVARINCDDEVQLCTEHGVNAFPTLKIFQNGTAKEYDGPREADMIVGFLKRQALPSLSVLEPYQLDEFIQYDDVAVVGILSAQGSSADRQVLEKVAEILRDHYSFGLVMMENDRDINSVLGDKISTPSIVVYNRFDNSGPYTLEGPFSQESTEQFIRRHALGLVGDLSDDNYDNYLATGLPLGCFFVSSLAERITYLPILEILAKEFRGQINFGFVNANDQQAHAEALNLKPVWPAFGVQVGSIEEKYPLDQSISTIDISSMRKLVHGVLDGTEQPSFRSEAVPDSNDGPVTVVVGLTYSEIVEDPSKDVLIEFYAPWCEYCQELEPIYAQLGKKFQGTNVVIAKIDATANDLPKDLSLNIPSYPTIKFRRAGMVGYMDYTGERTQEDFTDFIMTNAATKPRIKSEEADISGHVDIKHDEL